MAGLSLKSLRVRLFMALLGLVIAVAGFGLPVQIALNAAQVHFFDVVVGCLFFALGLFGLEFAIQALRQTSWKAGYFATGIRLLTKGHPVAISIGVPLVLVLLIVGSAATGDGQGLDMTLCASGFWLGFLVNTASHEVGHALAARFGGLKVVQVDIPPLELAREASGLRLRLIRVSNSPFSGRVLFKTQPPITPRQQIVLAAGGPAANIALLLVLLSVNPYDGPTLLKLASPGAVLVAASLGGALFMGLSNLVPFRFPSTGYFSDGAVILQGLRRLRGSEPQ
jgi:hypothetical protein